MNTEWRILILLTILEVGITGTAIIYDPAIIPDPIMKCLAYVSTIISSLLIIYGLYSYFTIKAQEDWRLGLARFFLLYFCLIVGFSSVYYLISDDFKDTPHKDIVLEELISEFKKRQEQIPQLQEDAELEYNKWNKLEEEKRAIYSLIEEIINRHRQMSGGKSPPPDVVPLYKELENVDDREKQLNHELISRHKVYLAAKLLADKATAEIRKYSYFNFIYFSIVTVATVGYGDIVPKTRRAKMLVTSEIILGGILILIYLTLVLGGRQRDRDRELGG
jgi:hypothetical protein